MIVAAKMAVVTAVILTRSWLLSAYCLWLDCRTAAASLAPRQGHIAPRWFLDGARRRMLSPSDAIASPHCPSIVLLSISHLRLRAFDHLYVLKISNQGSNGCTYSIPSLNILLAILDIVINVNIHNFA